jgi:hypothetical protein
LSSELGGDSTQAEIPPANLILLCNGLPHCSLVLVGLHQESLVPRLQPGGDGNQQWRKGFFLLPASFAALTMLLPLSQLEHLAHSAEASGELAKESLLALRKVCLGFLLAFPINAINELGWDGVLLLSIFFELCSHYFIVEVLWVKLRKLLALEIDSELSFSQEGWFRLSFG